MQLVRRLTTILLFFFSITWVACQEKKDRQGSQQSDIPESLSQKALLITADELAEGWKPLIDWKRKRGIYIELHTISEIKAAEKGPDTQEKIRQFVQKQITNNEITSLILGGDSLPGGRGLVPDRDTFHQNMWGESADIPTDLYYLSSTNWDADGDGVYGEYEDDQEAISYPDGSVGLGRIPVRTLVDIAAYTQKVIAYESRYPSEEFANNFLYSCTVPAAHPKLRKSWDDYISKKFPNGKIQWYSTDESPWDQEEKGDYDINSSHLVKLFNDSRMGKMHFHGHGIFPGWVMEDQQNLFTYQHVHQLKNLNAYPLITTVSCFTGQYDAEYDPCIAESMIRKENAGAIAIIAPCREGKPHFVNPDEEFPLMMKEGKLDGTTLTMTLFWEKGIEEHLTTGHALMSTKAGLAPQAKASANFHMALCELNLLGDPTLMVHPISPTK